MLGMVKVVSNAAVDRLRESRRQGEEAEAHKGYECGWEWADRHAEAVELDRLEEFSRSVSGYGDDRSDAFGPAHHVLGAIEGGDVERSDSEQFWRDALGVDYPTGAILAGFVEGALDFWERAREMMEDNS
jgi:hypothetical protein